MKTKGSVLIILSSLGLLAGTAAFASGDRLTGSYQIVVGGTDADCPNGNAPTGIQVRATDSEVTVTQVISYGTAEGKISENAVQFPIGDGVDPEVSHPTAGTTTEGGKWHAQYYSAGEVAYQFQADDGPRYNILYSLLLGGDEHSLELRTVNTYGVPMLCHYYKN